MIHKSVHKRVPELQMHGRLDRKPIFSASVDLAQGMIVQMQVYTSDLNGNAIDRPPARPQPVLLKSLQMARQVDRVYS